MQKIEFIIYRKKSFGIQQLRTLKTLGPHNRYDIEYKDLPFSNANELTVWVGAKKSFQERRYQWPVPAPSRWNWTQCNCVHWIRNCSPVVKNLEAIRHIYHFVTFFDLCVTQ